MASQVQFEAIHLYSNVPVAGAANIYEAAIDDHIRAPGDTLACKIFASVEHGLNIFEQDPPNTFVEKFEWHEIEGIANFELYSTLSNILVVKARGELHLFQVSPMFQVGLVSQQLINLQQSKMQQNLPPVDNFQRFSLASEPALPNEQDLELDVLQKCQTEIAFFTDQYQRALGDFMASNQRIAELQQVINNKKTKKKDKQTAETKLKSESGINFQIKQFLDAIVSNAAPLIQILEKFRLAWMLLNRHRAYFDDKYDGMVNDILNRFLLIAFISTRVRPDESTPGMNNFVATQVDEPYRVANAITQPMMFAEDVASLAAAIGARTPDAMAVWDQLGPSWKTGVENWQGEIKYYQPAFPPVANDPIALKFLDPAVIQQQISWRSNRNAAVTPALSIVPEEATDQPIGQPGIAGSFETNELVTPRVSMVPVHNSIPQQNIQTPTSALQTSLPVERVSVAAVPTPQPRVNLVPAPIPQPRVSVAPVPIPQPIVAETPATFVQPPPGTSRMNSNIQDAFRNKLINAGRTVGMIINASVVDLSLQQDFKQGEIVEVLADFGDISRVQNADGFIASVPKHALFVVSKPEPPPPTPSIKVVPSSDVKLDQSLTKIDRMAKVFQDTFREKLDSEGASIAIVITATPENSNGFETLRGEVLEVCEELNNDQVRVKNCESQQGTVAKKTLLIKKAKPKQPEIVSPKPSTSGQQIQTQASFRAELEQSGRSLAVVISPSKDGRSGLKVSQGEVLEVLGEMPEGNVRVINSQGLSGVLPVKCVVIKKSKQQKLKNETTPSLSPEVQLAFRERLENAEKHIGIAITPAKDNKSGEQLLQPGEIVEVGEDIGKGLIRVTRVNGVRGVVARAALFISQPKAEQPTIPKAGIVKRVTINAKESGDNSVEKSKKKHRTKSKKRLDPAIQDAFKAKLKEKESQICVVTNAGDIDADLQSDFQQGEILEVLEVFENSCRVRNHAGTEAVIEASAITIIWNAAAPVASLKPEESKKESKKLKKKKKQTATVLKATRDVNNRSIKVGEGEAVIISNDIPDDGLVEIILANGTNAKIKRKYLAFQ